MLGFLRSTEIILSLCFWGEHAKNGSKVETNIDKQWSKEENKLKKKTKLEIKDRNCTIQLNFFVIFQV